MLDKEKLAIIRDDILWIKESLKYLDPNNEDDKHLYDKYNNILKDHGEFLKNQLFILENIK